MATQYHYVEQEAFDKHRNIVNIQQLHSQQQQKQRGGGGGGF